MPKGGTMLTDIERVTIEIKNMTIAIFPHSQEVQVLFRGGFPPITCTLDEFIKQTKEARAS